MRRFRTWAACVLAVLLGLGIWASTWGDEGRVAALQAYVATKPQARVLFISDSWGHGDSYPGKTFNPATNKPYGWASTYADSSSAQGNEFSQQLCRRLGTNLFTSLSVGTMQMMLSNDANTARAQKDSSMFGFMRSEYAEQFDPDIVILPGGGGGNDMFVAVGSSNYAQLKAEAKALAKQALAVFSGADWIVWIAPRPIGIYHYTALVSGTDAQRQIAAAAQYELWEDFTTYCADTLRTDLAAAGVDVNRFVTWNSRPYSVIAEADTAGVFASIFEATTTAQNTVVKNIRWSPLTWLQGDYVHYNDLGNKSYADSIAAHLFGVDIEAPYTKGGGATVYMSYNTGHNHLNRTRCTDRNYPLKTLQAAVNQAHPGDIVRVIGTGNQASVAYEVSGGAKRSALTYEATIKKKGLTIILEDGAYFSGIYDSDTTIPSGTSVSVGSNFIDPYNCSDGSEFDRFSHAHNDSMKVNLAHVDLDLTIIGEGDDNWISGYITPLQMHSYDRVTFRNLKFTGGSGTIAAYLLNYGNLDLDFAFEDCTFYPDSASVAAATGQVRLQLLKADASTDLDDSTSFSGWFKRCDFIGITGVTLTALYGPLQGVDLIECQFTDPDVNVNWVDFGTAVTIPTGQFEPFKAINCSWRTTDNLTTQYAIKYPENGEDTLYVINCDYFAPNATNAFIIDFTVDAGTGMEVYVAGTAFVKADFNSGTDISAAAAGAATTVTDGYSIRSYNTKSLGLTGDTLRFGGVQSFAGYDLTDHFGISHPTKTASIGPVQYGYDPLVWTSGAVQGRPSAATMAGPWEILKFVNAGVMATSTSTDPSTWFEIPRIYDESSLAVARSFLDAWEKWPAANQAKVRFKVSGEPVTTITAADGSVYQTLGALDAAITATTESASDSLTASTWFTLPRPYNLNAAFQIEILRAWHRTLAEANRKKIRLRVSGTDYSLAQPDTTYSNGLWAALKAITTGAETASDSLNDATWFMSSRVYDMAQAQQYGLYRDAWVGWPVATRQKVRMKTK